MLHRLLLLSALAALPICARPGEEPQPLRFEVASVKPSEPGGRGGGIQPTPGNQGYIARNINVRVLLFIAFSVTDRQVSGAPAWFDTERYDILAKAEKPSTVDELHRMLQSLLADRFQLKVHHETKEGPVYTLTVDKAGLKMTEHDEQDKKYEPIRPLGPGKVTANNVAMFSLCLVLSNQLDRHVVDKTGLTKHYDFKLEWVPENLQPGGDAAPAPDGPNVFTALREQLGLRLTGEKGPIDLLVVDHAEKPSEN